MIRGYNLKDSSKICVLLKYNKGISVIQNIKKVSSPSRSIYFSKIDIEYWKNKTKHDFLIISSNKGVISSNEVDQLKVGGKIFCIIS
jgi:ribosomal protein S8